MENLNRRGFLRNSLSAGAIAAVASVPTVAYAMSEENPELLALGAKLDRTIQVFEEADRAKAEARGAFEANCPSVPDQLVCRGPADRAFAERETDIEGKDIWPAHPGRGPRMIYSSAGIARYFPGLRGRGKAARYYRGLHDDALAYEQQYEALRKRVGFDARATERYFAARSLNHLVEDIVAAEARTVEGVLIKCRALKANKGVGDDCGRAERLYGGSSLVEDVLTILGRAL